MQEKNLSTPPSQQVSSKLKNSNILLIVGIVIGIVTILICGFCCVYSLFSTSSKNDKPSPSFEEIICWGCEEEERYENYIIVKEKIVKDLCSNNDNLSQEDYNRFFTEDYKKEQDYEDMKQYIDYIFPSTFRCSVFEATSYSELEKKSITFVMNVPNRDYDASLNYPAGMSDSGTGFNLGVSIYFVKDSSGNWKISDIKSTEN
ncbi:hypothetical protein JW766_01405 [Candidatus Dojkabacteria bacterium]|nr:hypothetical protein [Candidatus Dojkabacteria bacterium]